MTRSLEHIIARPESLVILPMIYVAWADGDLDPQEWSTIQNWAKIRLADRPTEWIAEWTDATNPPTAVELASLLGHIKSVSSRLSVDEHRTLVDVGAELARHASMLQGDEITWSEEELDALRELEGAVGLGDPDALSDLGLSPPDPADASSPLVVDRLSIRRLLDGRYHDRKEKMRELLAHPLFVHEYEQPKARERERIWALCQFIAERGLGELAFPGVTCEGDLGEFVSVFEFTGLFDLNLSVKYGVQCGLFGGSIYFLGTERHHEQYLHRVADMSLPGCFAMTEVGHGSNVRGLETTATYVEEEDAIVIHSPSPSAAKEWIGNAAIYAQMATVFAQLHVGDEEHGVHAILVPIRDAEGNALPGVTLSDCGQKLGLNGVDNGRVSFDHVQVPVGNLLDRYASIREGKYESPIASGSKRFFTMLSTLVGGRVAVGAAGLSAAKVALAIAIRYGNRRRQFGSRGQESLILDYPTHQLRLLPRLAEAYGLTFALGDLVDRYVEGDESDARTVEVLAAAMKVRCTWMATDTIQTCRECCGGQGYRAINRFAALKADSDIFTTFEGDNTVLAQLVAKGLLSEFKEQFHDSKWFQLLKYVTKAAVSSVTERNPIMQRLTHADHLLSEEFHSEALAYRQERLLSAAARRIGVRVAQGMSAFDAFVDIQDHLVALAKAYADREVHDSFVRAVARVEDRATQTVLEQLRALYGLSKLHEHAGWFLENDAIEANKAAAIRSERNRLCRALRPSAEALVEAMGIPESCISAPIANAEV